MSHAVQRLIDNANRLGRDPIHTSVAIEVVTGEPWTALCCWCIERVDPAGARQAVRLRVGGDCMGCAYIGRDTLLVGLARD